MGKYFFVIGFLILAFILASNFLPVQLPNVGVVILGITSALFLVSGNLVSQLEKKELK